MKLFLILFEVLYSMVFASISLAFTVIIHRIKNDQGIIANKKFISPALTFSISAGLSFCLLANPPETMLELFQGIAVIVILSMVAYFDHFSRHIPAYLMIISFVFSLFIFAIDKQKTNFLIGGLSNFIISLSIYYCGNCYSKKIKQSSDNLPAFGFGDVYGLSALGFLLGFPKSMWGLVLALILLLIYALIKSRLTGKSFLNLRVKMGFFIFLSASLILII